VEIVFAVVGLIGVWVLRTTWRDRRNARAVALRRAVFVDRQDVFQDTWTVDFVEMLAVHEYRVFDWPPTEGNTLYELRRLDGPAWQVRIHRECRPELLRDMERSAEEFRWEPEQVAETRANILSPEWQSVGEHRSAEIESHYQVFLRHYDPSVDVEAAGMEDYWRSLLAMQLKREKEREERAKAARESHARPASPP
jgi:hypothetical protein